MRARQRVAILGLGMASTPHAKSLVDLAASGRIELGPAWSRSQERRSAFTASFPAFQAASELEAIVDDPSIDAVLLLTPPNARMEMVQRLAGAGKHILMEKPVERTTVAAEQIVESCERAGVRLGIVFQHRFREGSERLAGMLASGELGPLGAVMLSVPWWRPQAYYDVPGRGTLERDGGGVLISQAIHSLDLMLGLVGPVSEVAAIGGTTRLHRMATEDFVGAGLRFANGALGSLVASTAVLPGGPERLVIAGERATATLEAGNLTIDWSDGRQDRFGEPVGSGGGGADPMAFPHDWHRALITDFLDAIEEGREPRIPGRKALLVHRLIDALLRSAGEGRAIRLGDADGLP
jgi:UDP-N-acetyl-2-amino-2-deoxyglucuronate dehydrogenase